MKTPIKVLIIEDSENDALLAIDELRRTGYAPEFKIVDTAETTDAALRARAWDLVISGDMLPGLDAPAVLKLVREKDPDLPFIVISGTMDEETAVAAIRAGAHDCLMKNDLARLPAVVERELRETELRREYRKMQAALKENQSKYRPMVESMKDPVCICSPDYRIEYINPAMIKRTGRDATGEKCFRALHALEKKCPWCRYDKIQKGESHEMDIVSPMDNRAFHLSCSPVVNIDKSVSIMSLFRDTTDLKKMEAKLQQAQKMEAIGTLAGGIAHDFNNILFPIFGYTQMLLEEAPEEGALHHGLTQILAGAERARDLVKQILTFSRHRHHALKPVKTQLVIKEALKLIKSTLPSTIEIHQDIDSDCGPVMADPTQIHQIVMNLCTNAYHAMEKKGGRLTVTLEEVRLDMNSLHDSTINPGPHVCMTVADTGIGMNRSVMDRIFDPYFTTKKEGRGTGLGLAVIHGIVNSHHGHISVYSEPGRGSEFKVFLPVIREKTETALPEADRSIKKGSARILLVDDEKMIVEVETQMLERLGYHVTARDDSMEALEIFREKPGDFDMVITDMTMPHMTGDQLSAEMIKLRPDIPIILCTGFSEMMSEEKAASLGIKEFLMKPVTLRNLSNTICKVLEDKQESRAYT